MAIAGVRPATPDDVDDVVRIQAGVWALAYADVLPAAAIEQISGPQARAAWAAAVDAGGAEDGAAGGGQVFVATEGAWTVGFCAVAPAVAPEGSRPPQDPTLGPEAWAEIGTLLVEPRWGRRGHGGRLLHAAATASRDRGAVYGLAWVPERDTASQGFYPRAGWRPDGAVRVLDTGNGELREVRVTGSLDLQLD